MTGVTLIKVTGVTLIIAHVGNFWNSVRAVRDSAVRGPHAIAGRSAFVRHARLSGHAPHHLSE